jgi:AraC-like DNA-binding protein
MEKQRIRFVDSVNNTLFTILDGEDIELEIDDEWIRHTCRYIDENHFDLDGCIYHIAEFAQLSEILVQRCRPAIKQVKVDAEHKKKIRFIDT